MSLIGVSKTCPVCGEAVTGLLKVKIKDKIPLCQNCSRKINMDGVMIPHQSVQNIKDHIAYRDNNLRLFKNFAISREQKAGNLLIRVDDSQMLWYCDMKNATNPPLFQFGEIVDYELTENGETVIKGGLGTAVAGGLLLGRVGAIVGGITGKKHSKTVVKSMKLRISLSNQYINQILIEFIPFGSSCKSGNFIYNTYKSEANRVVSLLDSISGRAAQNSHAQATTPSTSDGADEILKFKALLDSGIITQEEYEAKKKQILNL